MTWFDCGLLNILVVIVEGSYQLVTIGIQSDCDGGGRGGSGWQTRIVVIAIRRLGSVAHLVKQASGGSDRGGRIGCGHTGRVCRDRKVLNQIVYCRIVCWGCWGSGHRLNVYFRVCRIHIELEVIQI